MIIQYEPQHVDPRYWPYQYFGPPKATKGTWRGVAWNIRYLDRPHCDMCGPFRGCFLRYLGHDEFGPVYRCRGCDEE